MPPLPDGLEVRPVDGRDQIRQIWDADVEAFQDHWGGFDCSEAELPALARPSPSFDPDAVGHRLGRRRGRRRGVVNAI